MKLTPLSPRVMACSRFPAAFPALELMSGDSIGFQWVTVGMNPRHGLWHSQQDAIDWLTMDHRGDYRIHPVPAPKAKRSAA